MTCTSRPFGASRCSTKGTRPPSTVGVESSRRSPAGGSRPKGLARSDSEPINDAPPSARRARARDRRAAPASHNQQRRGSRRSRPPSEARRASACPRAAPPRADGALPRRADVSPARSARSGACRATNSILARVARRARPPRTSRFPLPAPCWQGARPPLVGCAPRGSLVEHQTIVRETLDCLNTLALGRPLYFDLLFYRSGEQIDEPLGLDGARQPDPRLPLFAVHRAPTCIEHRCDRRLRPRPATARFVPRSNRRASRCLPRT